MKFQGGFNVLLEGRPEGLVKVMPEPKVLYLPLQTKRFNFSDVRVTEGDNVEPGEFLATDPDNYSIPLLAPRAGKVRLDVAAGYIVLDEIARHEEHPHTDEDEMSHIVQEMGAGGIKRYKLLNLGAWEFFSEAYSGNVPDPLGTPQAVIVSTVSLEPFVARGDAQLHNRLLQFTRGLEHLQSLLEYQPIYLIMPDITSAFATRVREHIRGYAWVKLIEVPMRYPYDNFNILARKFGLKKEAGPVWSIKTEGVLAVDRALTMSKPCLLRILSVGGPRVHSPIHICVMPGYPLKKILDTYASGYDYRVIINGMLSGEMMAIDALGVDSECRGLTIISELKEREFLGFVRPGWDRQSYSECFLSSLRKNFRERFTTAFRGEGRPCVSCNYCAEVCPAEILPHRIHKYLYSDLIEEADASRVDLCVQCGLCSFVCPSKIELKQQFFDAKIEIEQEKEEARLEALKREQEAQESAE
ncbi:MAG: 4Fe-4S dicluster domain-containing protein [Planctomycetes bacterium]|nr:4Fe-4S dicluster domain-containing protein [Planctomycetota bacterium]